MRLLVGHDPWYVTDDDEDGTDILVTVWDNDTITVALRPGKGRTGWTWGPPVTMTEADQ